ncbi:ThiF family adenylyltransferase [Falsibacillus pallidus]|uniref:ThiF family protein n=1 Tax=Falsibacillus pallidus TaxID=493781 RepID=A0A370G0X3_9BACI|nr:ThiF family adenylyltransferase [Falsibacillus pallidus]RDI37531.1 ThiF family protein [Falsibacillus pallidus]
MSIPLIDHNTDLKKLKVEGYNVLIINSNLVIKGVPYVNKEKKILFGTIYCPLTLSGDMTVPPQDHTVRFVGEHPCDQFGNEEKSYVHSHQSNTLTGDIIGSYYFSSKPQNGSYSDFYTKMKKYIDLLSAPAKSIDSSVSAQNFAYENYNNDSVFKYPDTNSARAGVAHLSERLGGQKIAIVGLGGTGSFVLDFVIKTPVAQISIFDGDEMYNHNSFRIPGAMDLEELKLRPSKVSYLKRMYDKFRNGITAHEVFLDDSNVNLLYGHDFVFLAVDQATAKQPIIDYLIASGIPFVDLGMGISLVQDSLRGVIRKTLVTPDNKSYLNKIAIGQAADEDIYATNIQIAELNALNAVMGVIAWKKMNGIYLSEDAFMHSTFILDEEEINNEA